MRLRQRSLENHADDWQRLLDGMEADPLSYTESRLILPAYDRAPHRPDEDVWLEEEIFHFASRLGGGDPIPQKERENGTETVLHR